MKTAGDITERIFSAADSLFEQNAHAAFPTVDAVRKLARVSMNDANSGMRDWRRQQMARAVAPPAQVPAAIVQAQAALTTEIWQSAQRLAGESLVTAQTAWDAERGELESLNREMAEAFERQVAASDEQRAQVTALNEQLANALAASTACQQELAALRERCAVAESDARRDAARLDEVERRASDLRVELDRAHQELAAAHEGGRAARSAHADELAAVRADARQSELVLREELESLRAHQRELMRLVSAGQGAASSSDASRPENAQEKRQPKRG